MTTSAVASGQPSPSGAGLQARQTRSLLTPEESIQHPAGSCRARAQHLSTHPHTLACGWPRPRPRCREQGLLCARASSQRSHQLLLNRFGASDTAFAPRAPQHGLTRSFGQIFPLSTWQTGNVLQSSGWQRGKQSPALGCRAAPSPWQVRERPGCFLCQVSTARETFPAAATPVIAVA